jgi:hypothetical protein
MIPFLSLVRERIEVRVSFEFQPFSFSKKMIPLLSLVRERIEVRVFSNLRFSKK